MHQCDSTTQRHPVYIHQAGALCSNPGLLDPQMAAPNSREASAKGKVSGPQGWELQQLIRGVRGAQRLESSAFLLGGVATVLTASSLGEPSSPPPSFPGGEGGSGEAGTYPIILRVRNCGLAAWQVPVDSWFHLWELGFLLVKAVDVDIQWENGQGRTGAFQMQPDRLQPHRRSRRDKCSPPQEPGPGTA